MEEKSTPKIIGESTQGPRPRETLRGAKHESASHEGDVVARVKEIKLKR